MPLKHITLSFLAFSIALCTAKNACAQNVEFTESNPIAIECQSVGEDGERTVVQVPLDEDACPAGSVFVGYAVEQVPGAPPLITKRQADEQEQ
jgi:hypothetical protein